MKSNREFYKGFHRRDINHMLKDYAESMYEKKVRDEELLLFKIKPEIKDDVVEREYISRSNITSYFNPVKQSE